MSPASPRYGFVVGAKRGVRERYLRAKMCKADEWLSKPLVLDRLSAAIQRVLSRVQ